MNANDGVERGMPTATSPESWDITTNLGATALSVAALRAAETAQDDRWFVTSSPPCWLRR